MVKIMTKIKLGVLNFGYVIGINMTIMYINFQTNLQVLLKLQSNSFNIAPNELKLAVLVKGGEDNIPIKFQVILKKLKF